jgi:hypothetical protein
VTEDPQVLGGVRAEQEFGDLAVIRLGVRGGHTAQRPSGYPAAVCRCAGCGRDDVIVPLYRLLNGGTKSCGTGPCFRPLKSGVRDRIIAYVARRGGAWMSRIRDDLQMTGGAASGHLSHLVASGRLERPARGFYCLPGEAPAAIPEPPPETRQARSAGNSKAGVSRWQVMTGDERRQRVALLTAGRASAARRRCEQQEEERPCPGNDHESETRSSAD